MYTLKTHCIWQSCFRPCMQNLSKDRPGCIPHRPHAEDTARSLKIYTELATFPRHFCSFCLDLLLQYANILLLACQYTTNF